MFDLAQGVENNDERVSQPLDVGHRCERWGCILYISVLGGVSVCNIMATGMENMFLEIFQCSMSRERLGHHQVRRHHPRQSGPNIKKQQNKTQYDIENSI